MRSAIPCSPRWASNSSGAITQRQPCLEHYEDDPNTLSRGDQESASLKTLVS
jgi:hypothetical protein